LGVELLLKLNAESRSVGEPYERGQPAIDAAHRRVFVGSSDHGLYALRAEDGETVWRYETTGAVQSEPLYDAAEDVVYFGSNDGALYKVRASDGLTLWRFMTNAEVSRRPVLVGNILYVVNANDTLIAIHKDTGQLKWSQHRTPAFGMEISGYAGPMVAHGKVYAAFSDGVVLAYSAEDGSEQWPIVDLAAEAEQSAPGGNVPRFLDVDTTPIAGHITSGDVIYVGSYAGGVFALDAEDGSRAWVNDKVIGVTELAMYRQPAHRLHPDSGPMIPEKKVLIAASGPTGLWGLSPEDGRTLWRRSLPAGGFSAPVQVAGGILISSTRFGVFLFSPLDGALIDGVALGGGFAMTPAAFGLRAFVVSNSGTLLGLHITPPGASWPESPSPI
jgi:outer membrane protein assembly factor BamB